MPGHAELFGWAGNRIRGLEQEHIGTLTKACQQDLVARFGHF